MELRRAATGMPFNCTVSPLSLSWIRIFSAFHDGYCEAQQDNPCILDV